jgi:hypothetical protein
MKRNRVTDQQRDLIASLLKAEPETSDRQIAKQAKVDHSTIARARGVMEVRGEIPGVEAIITVKGHRRYRAKKKRPGPTHVAVPTRLGGRILCKDRYQPIPSNRVAKNDLIGRIKELDAEKSKLIESAKSEALERAKQAVADLNALGFSYSLTQVSVGRKPAGRKGLGGIPTEKPCRICGFRTSPPHDARRHRFSKAKKRPFNAKELTDLGMRKV